MILSNEIIDRLESVMAAKGINQREIAEKQGKGKSAYNVFKNRVLKKQELTEVNLVKLLKDKFLNPACQILGVDRYYIVYGEHRDVCPGTPSLLIPSQYLIHEF